MIPTGSKTFHAPELENKLRNAIVDRAKKYKNCFGNGPQVIVRVQELLQDKVMDGVSLHEPEACQFQPPICRITNNTNSWYNC
jgi:hypothetical protein